MKSQLEIIKLANQKLAAAKSLVETGHYDDAYYLAGYTIELLLKARICKILNKDDFFTFEKLAREDYRVFKKHDYSVLFMLSGLQRVYEEAIKDPDLIKEWAIIINWNESTRYVSGQKPTDVKQFVMAVEKISIWIQKHL